MNDCGETLLVVARTAVSCFGFDEMPVVNAQNLALYGDRGAVVVESGSGHYVFTYPTDQAREGGAE